MLIFLVYHVSYICSHVCQSFLSIFSLEIAEPSHVNICRLISSYVNGVSFFSANAFS